MNNFDENYWTKRYDEKRLGWDIGYVSTPLKAYFDQLSNKNLQVLIPGAGSAHEAEYLHGNDFKNVHVLDVSMTPLRNFQKRIPTFPKEHVHKMDFFSFEGQYDLIIEQTFFCALDPRLRPSYVKKMKSLLKPGGRLVGLLFNRVFEKEGPPFGGVEVDYRKLFQDDFTIEIMEASLNSVSERSNTELFFKMVKPES